MLVKGFHQGVSKTRSSFMKCVAISKITTTTNGKNTSCRCGCITCVCGTRNAVVGNSATKPYFQPRSAISTTDGKLDPLDVILQNNRDWVKKTQETDPHFFEVAGSIHKPKYLYFGCSDARVPANLILGLGPGEVFVHRNVGNLVPVNDLNALSCLEYAVGHLGVTDIIVTGHYDCGK